MDTLIAVIIDLERPAHALLFTAGLAFIIIWAFFTGVTADEFNDTGLWFICITSLFIIMVTCLISSFISFTRLFRYGWDYRCVRIEKVESVQQNDKSVVEKLSDISPEYTVENKPEVEPAQSQ